MEVVAEKELVVAQGGAVHSAFPGEDRAVGEAALHGRHGVRESASEEGLARRDGGLGGKLGVRTGSAVEGDPNAAGALKSIDPRAAVDLG